MAHPPPPDPWRQTLLAEQFAAPPPRLPRRPPPLEPVDELQAWRNRQVLIEALPPDEHGGEPAADSEVS